jgi:hypothetical protein
MAFMSATKDDRLYKCFYYNKPEIYWRARRKDLAKIGITVSDEFVDLASAMLAYNPDTRLSIN